MAQKTGGRTRFVHTITVTDLRTDLRKHLGLARYRSRHAVMERNHELFVMIRGPADLCAAGWQLAPCGDLTALAGQSEAFVARAGREVVTSGLG